MTLTGLNMAAFTVTPNSGGSPPSFAMLGLLKAFSMTADNDQVDSAGLADRYERMMNVKQGQVVDFSTYVAGSPQPVLTNLDIALWEFGSTNYLGSIRSGRLDVTTEAREASGIASAYKAPNATRTKVKLTTQKLVVSNVAFLGTLLTGTASSFDVTAAVTWGGTAFVMPMTIKSAKQRVERDEMQLEEVVCTGKGTPSGPADNSLLGNILLGTAQVALAIDTGGGQFDTGSGLWALITKLSTRFVDAGCIEQVGQFVFQGPASFATG